jgi:acetyl-CoA C-acetyltransferase
MREVAVIGIGQTKIDEHWDKSLRELAGEAILAAVNDAKMDHVDALFVGNMMSGSANHQHQLGAYIADWVGLRYSESYKLETACSSGASAFRSALMAVSSGAIDSAIAIGVEKMTDSPGAEITSELSTAADADWEVSQGVSFVALNALIMKRYMFEYGWQKTDFAQFSINAHANGVYNPNARFRKAITEKQYIDAGMIADPINLMDASPIGDGAAALLLVPVENIHNKTNDPTIKIIGSAAATDSIAVHGRKDPLWLSAAEKTSKIAYSQAGLVPKDIDLFEAHDAFSIMAALSLEASGFAERGQAPRLAINGEITPSGKIPISTRGGLKARGHPVGATGLYQLVEVVQQLRHTAEGTQVENAKFGMAQNIGGSGSNIVTHILQRVEH